MTAERICESRRSARCRDGWRMRRVLYAKRAPFARMVTLAGWMARGSSVRTGAAAAFVGLPRLHHAEREACHEARGAGCRGGHHRREARLRYGEAGAAKQAR